MTTLRLSSVVTSVFELSHPCRLTLIYEDNKTLQNQVNRMMGVTDSWSLYAAIGHVQSSYNKCQSDVGQTDGLIGKVRLYVLNLSHTCPTFWQSEFFISARLNGQVWFEYFPCASQVASGSLGMVDTAAVVRTTRLTQSDCVPVRASGGPT